MSSNDGFFKPRHNITAGSKHEFMRAALREYDLTGAAFKVLYVLCDFHSNEHGYAYPSYDKIQSETKGLRRETISDALHLLSELGLVKIRKAKNNRYLMNWHLIDDNRECRSGNAEPGTMDAGNAASPAGIQRQLLPVDESENRTRSVRKPDSMSPETGPYTSYDPSYRHSLQDTPAAIASEPTGHVLNLSPAEQPKAGNDNWPADAVGRFWKLYPYAEYRQDQLDGNEPPDEAEDFRLSKIELHKLRKKSVPFEAVVSGVARYRDHVCKRGAKYIVAPHTWIRNEHWLDQPSTGPGGSLHAKARAMTRAAI
jgi:hypothetical protein